VSIVDLSRSRTAFAQSVPCSVSTPIWMPAGSAAFSVWSRTGFVGGAAV